MLINNVVDTGVEGAGCGRGYRLKGAHARLPPPPPRRSETI
jgi:hypothetical protein